MGNGEHWGFGVYVIATGRARLCADADVGVCLSKHEWSTVSLLRFKFTTITLLALLFQVQLSCVDFRDSKQMHRPPCRGDDCLALENEKTLNK